MTIPAVHCEARKMAYRQSKEGLVVSFVIHPNDMPDALAVAPLGQRYMLALAAIGDDETPSPLTGPVSDRPTPNTDPSPQKARYSAQTSMEKARDRACMLCADERFRRFLGAFDEDQATRHLRAHLNINSRSEIATNTDAYDEFIKLETEYLQWAGLMPELR